MGGIFPLAIERDEPPWESRLDNAGYNHLTTCPTEGQDHGTIPEGGRATEIVPQQSGTGKYEYFCTSYTGVTMGWNGKIIRACHGWMNVYISGKHVARYCPDLIPDPPNGGRVTVMCVLNTAATIVTIFTPAGTIGTVAAKTFTSAVGIVGVNMECRK